MHKFICLEEATELYKMTKKLKLRSFMLNQLQRASSSVALNLAEGNARRTLKDRLKYFNIAYASLKEVQAICRLEDLKIVHHKADRLGGLIYSLTRNLTEAVDRD